MKKINIELTLNDSAWEVICERAKKSYETIRKEMADLGEDYTFDDAVKNELRYIVERDVEMYDIYDEICNYAEVQSAVRSAKIKRLNEKRSERAD